MKMKFSKIFMVLAGPALILAASCNKTQELDYDIVPGNALYAPEDGTEIDLTTGLLSSGLLP